MSYSFSSGEQTSDGAIKTGQGQLCNVQVLTDGTNDATVILYDNTAASGTKIFEALVTGASGDDFGFFDFSTPVRFKTGCFLDITGTGASCIVYLA